VSTAVYFSPASFPSLHPSLLLSFLNSIEDNVDEAHESVTRTQDYLLGVCSRLFLTIIPSLSLSLSLRIEDNVDEAHESVTRTRDYLLGVYSRLSNNGPLVLKSFLVLISFVIMFVLFIA